MCSWCVSKTDVTECVVYVQAKEKTSVFKGIPFHEKKKIQKVSAIHHNVRLQTVVNDYKFGWLSQTAVQLFAMSPCNIFLHISNFIFIFVFLFLRPNILNVRTIFLVFRVCNEMHLMFAFCFILGVSLQRLNRSSIFYSGQEICLHKNAWLWYRLCS